MARKVEWKVAATLTTHNLAGMSPRQISGIRDWLRRLADDIAANPGQYSKRFTARYNAVVRKDKEK